MFEEAMAEGDAGAAASAEGNFGGGLLLGNEALSPQDGAQGQAQGAQDYGLNVPEGLYTPEQVALAEQQFRQMGLGQNTAQQLMDMSVAGHRQAREQHQAQVSAWAEEVRLDREMGGPALEATLMEAKSALGKFDGNGEVFGMLEQTGYANHPEVIRFLSRIGKALGEDTVVAGRATNQEKPLWERLYPTEKK